MLAHSYPKVLALRGGLPVEIRPLATDDLQRLSAFFQRLPPEFEKVQGHDGRRNQR